MVTDELVLLSVVGAGVAEDDSVSGEVTDGLVVLSVVGAGVAGTVFEVSAVTVLLVVDSAEVVASDGEVAMAELYVTSDGVVLELV